MTNKNKVIILNSIILLYGFIFQMVIINKFLRYSSLITASFMVVMLGIAISLIGFRKDTKTDLKVDIFFKTFILVVLFFIITYASGLLLGYSNNAYSRVPIMLLNNTFAPVIFILSIEVYRYVIISSINKQSKLITFSSIAIIIFEICANVRLFELFSLLEFFRISTTKIIPIICKNFVMSSLCEYGGLRSTLFYRIIMDTYIYLVPIVPNFSEYIISILGIFFPLVIYICTISNLKEDTEKIIFNDFEDNFGVRDAAFLTIIICLVMLLSGAFPLTIVGIVSHSMYPKICRGDAVIYKKVSDEKNIKVGDILVFESDNKIIVHRLVETESIDNNLYFITKGDNNNSNDDSKITFKDIKGTVLLKVKYIAYPSVWFSEFMKKRSFML